MAPIPGRWLICILLLFATTLNYLDRVALNQLINPIMAEFGLTDRDYGNLETAFAIAFGLGTLVTGWLVDRVNVRWVYAVVVLGWSVSGFLTGYASTFAMLMTCRVLLGLFEAGNWPCGIRTTRTVLAPEERSFGNALFQSGTAIGAILTPLVILACYEYYGKETPGVWAVPFRLIGLLGFVWVALWLMLTNRAMFPSPRPQQSSGEPFAVIFRDPRFWILIVVIIGVNTGWHTVRVWMPRLLKVTYGYDDIAIQQFGMWYYLCADLGSWTVGLTTLMLARKGFDLSKVRVATFVLCSLLLVGASSSLLWVPGPRGTTLALLLVGFAGLGLFPTYFAMSQDLSQQHQGKVTGTLGCINALYLAIMFSVQKEVAATTQNYSLLIALSGIPAVLASIILLMYWTRTTSA